MTVRLGIAITTLSRRAMLGELLDALTEHTTAEFDLVVCDDGSADGTLDMLSERRVPVVAGPNRGVAWNKNRSLFYLMNFTSADVILLLDDDVTPTGRGWEQGWIEAAARFGHVNYVDPRAAATILPSGGLATAPRIGQFVTGWCIATTRLALSYVGYMDTRFGRYGLEHVEFSRRFLRAGHGGAVWTRADGGTSCYFVLLSEGIAVRPSVSHGSRAEHDRNMPVFHSLLAEPIYRHAWRDDVERARLMAELATAVPAAAARPVPAMPWDFDERAYRLLNPSLPADFDPIAHYLLIGARAGWPHAV